MEAGVASLERVSAVAGRTRDRAGAGLPGYLVVALLTAIPVAMYFAGAAGLDDRGIARVVGESSGIAASALMGLVIIMVGRFRFLESLFGDLTRVYVAHAALGMLVLVLVSVHPLGYALEFMPSVSGMSQEIVPFYVAHIDWVAYILLSAAVLISLYGKLSFSTWRLSHMLLGIALILNTYVLVIRPSTLDTIEIPALRIYLAVLFAVAIGTFLWVAVIARWLDPKREYRITGVQRHPAADAVELTARPVGKPISFSAGQFVGVDLIDDRLHVNRDYEAHPFSITTAPGQEEIGLVIQAGGELTRRVQQMAETDGATALIHSPRGRLGTKVPRGRREMWIGGGSGITPFLSMAEELAADPGRGEGRTIDLVVGVDRAEQAFYWERLERCAELSSALTVHLWDRAVSDLPTAESLAELVGGDVSGATVMLSGPDPMIAALEAGFLALGVPRGEIRWERSIGPPTTWRDAAPAMRRLRVVSTAAFGIFATLVVASTIGHAI